MPRLFSIVSIVLLTTVCRAGEPPEGFKSLFNGKDLSGWHGWAIHAKESNPEQLAKLSPEARAKKIFDWTQDAKEHWSVEDGVLVNDGNGAFLATDKSYGDFELLIDYKTVPKADSGIYLRATPQVQIWDYTDKEKFKLGADKGSGGLWNNAAGAKGKDPLVKADNPLGEWNHFRIRMVGDKVTVYLNDKLVVDHASMANYWDRSKPIADKGPILLQTHGGEIRWKNIFIREIPADEANKILLEENKDGFEQSFNGHGFDGWDGAVDQYEIVDHALQCKNKKAGVIFTKESFTDFAVQLEFKMPPAGNNGLAIRYPGQGRATRTAMCEIQLLDDQAEKFRKLNPRNACGSIYGIVAPNVGYSRPAGEWNHILVNVQGPTITVELNGTRILHQDVTELNMKTLKDYQSAGLQRREGHFGFCGHNDPVKFRNIYIKNLNLSN